MSYDESLSENFAINATALKVAMESGALLVDVRFTNSILETGSVPDAFFIGIQGNLEGWAHVLINNKSVDIYILKEEASDFIEIKYRFQRAGFTNVLGYLNDGINEWIKEGYKTVPYNAIHPRDFVTNFESINHNLIIDVRSEREYENQHIVGSRNIPLDKLQQFITTLSADNEYYMICAGGYRSILAASILKQHHIYKTVDVYGGIKNFP